MNMSGQVETLCLPNGMISTRDLTHEEAIVLRLLGQVLVRMHVTAAGRSSWRLLPIFQCRHQFDAHDRQDAVYLNTAAFRQENCLPRRNGRPACASSQSLISAEPIPFVRSVHWQQPHIPGTGLPLCTASDD